MSLADIWEGGCTTIIWKAGIRLKIICLYCISLCKIKSRAYLHIIMIVHWTEFTIKTSWWIQLIFSWKISLPDSRITGYSLPFPVITSSPCCHDNLPLAEPLSFHGGLLSRCNWRFFSHYRVEVWAPNRLPRAQLELLLRNFLLLWNIESLLTVFIMFFISSVKKWLYLSDQMRTLKAAILTPLLTTTFKGLMTFPAVYDLLKK